MSFSRLAWLLLLPLHTLAAAPIDWIRSESDAFAQARRTQRPVLLYLEAVWCHWCHVMDHETYGEPRILAEIAAHYVPLRIDQDARPDLASRYRDYGWPATVVFTPDGREIVKRQGFQPPERFLRLLQAIDADPSPEAQLGAVPEEASITGSAHTLSEATRKALEQRYRDTYDRRLGGLTTAQKFLDRDSVELALVRGDAGDPDESARATQTLTAAQALFDPVWGGVYQYSTMGDWNHPHYEKLATIQAEYLRIHALAWVSLRRDVDRAAVASIRRYLETFLADPSGAYRVSQDADPQPGVHAGDYFSLDDAQRRARGVPQVDTHLYTQQTGQIAEALATWAELSGDASALREARLAAEWSLRERALRGGGFRHDARDSAGPYLADTLAMGRACLALYRATAERAWLQRAASAADFIERRFRQRQGYASARSRGPIAAVAQLDEVLSLARFANLLGRYSGQSRHRDMAAHALAWLTRPDVSLSRLTEAGILLADAESNIDPLHLTVIGGKDDPLARDLFSTTQQLPGWYKRVEWWDRREGKLPNADVAYPLLTRAAAFVCSERRCSLPLLTTQQLREFLQAERNTP